jgi:hypothetical protein
MTFDVSTPRPTPNEPEPWLWFAISGASHTIGLIIVAAIISVWV